MKRFPILRKLKRNNYEYIQTPFGAVNIDVGADHTLVQLHAWNLEVCSVGNTYTIILRNKATAKLNPAFNATQQENAL